MFWIDLAVAAPLDGIIAGAMGIELRAEDPRAQYIALVRWLKLVRSVGVNIALVRWLSVVRPPVGPVSASLPWAVHP